MEWVSAAFLQHSAFRRFSAHKERLGNVLAETLGGNPTDAGVAIRDRFVTALVITPTTDYVVDPDAVISIVFSNLAMLNRITARRVYLAGYSLGCRGTLRALVSYPNLFAAAVCSAGYAEQEGDNNLLQDGDAMPTYPLLDRAIGVPIAFGYSPVDETNAPEKTIATIDRLSDAGAVCNTVFVPWSPPVLVACLAQADAFLPPLQRNLPELHPFSDELGCRSSASAALFGLDLLAHVYDANSNIRKCPLTNGSFVNSVR